MSKQDNFSLLINGIKYEDCWKSIHVRKSMETIAGAFAVRTTDFYPGDDRDKWQIQMGDKYYAYINDTYVCTGYIEEINIMYGDGYHDIEIKGRDNTGDLVDCTYSGTRNEWKNYSVFNIISDLCEGFDVQVIIQKAAEKEAQKILKSFKADEGATVADLIYRICNENGIVPINLGDGLLQLASPNVVYVEKEILGKNNVISGEILQDNSGRFSEYIVKGQGRGRKTKSNLKDYIQPKGSWKDLNITRYRPLTLFSELSTDNRGCEERAIFEANKHAGASRKVSYVLPGWTKVSDGLVWAINRLVPVNDDKLGVFESMLINNIDFTVDPNEGAKTSIELVHKDTYTIFRQTPRIRTGFDAWTSLTLSR